MRLIIEARLEGADPRWPETGTAVLAVLEREDGSVDQLGLTLAEGRAVLAEMQSRLISHQSASWAAGNACCEVCGASLAHKDSRSIVMRTVFGKATLQSPRWLECRCTGMQTGVRRSSSPLCKALPRRVTPELEYLQEKWAAHLPYRQATTLLRQVLPLDQGISTGSTRRRVLAAGKALDAEIEHGISDASKHPATAQARESTSVGCVSVDSAWLRFSSTPKARRAARERAEQFSPCSMRISQERHVNIAAGRATFTDRAPRLYAYVHKQVPSAAARLDQFLRGNGVEPDERVTVICDDAGEFCKAVAGSRLARGKILDWFHIAMKVQAAHRSVLGSRQVEYRERSEIEQEIDGAKWLIWHGKGRRAVARIKALDAWLLPREGYEDSTLYWNLRRLYFYVENNAGTLVNYGARYRKGLPISSSIAESAVNQVVSHRMAKQQQMRWTDEGAHCLAQVRVADLNGEFSVQRLSEALALSTAANSPQARIAA